MSAPELIALDRASVNCVIAGGAVPVRQVADAISAFNQTPDDFHRGVAIHILTAIRSD